MVLRRKPDDANLVSDGPFAKGSFVDAPGVEPFEYNPLLAKGLIHVAKKELGGNPIKLTLEYPPTPEALAVCPKIAEAFALIDVAVTLVERPESELESSLHAGRRFDLAYRSSRPSQPLKDAGTLLVPGYDAPPSADALASAASPRILQLLIQLDQAPETTSARTLAQQIDRESRDELPVLPLWQLEDHHAWRSTLKGPLEVADHLYQGLAAWGDRAVVPQGLTSDLPRRAGLALPFRVRWEWQGKPCPTGRIAFGIILGFLTSLAQAQAPKKSLPIDARPYAIRLLIEFDPATRVDAARRTSILDEWSTLVRRFVGAPWVVEISPDSGLLAAIPIEGPQG